MRDPNRLPAPRSKSEDYAAGWRAREAGKVCGDNPHPLYSLRWHEWFAGNEDRGNRGFEIAHLPRKPFSDAFAF